MSLEAFGYRSERELVREAAVNVGARAQLRTVVEDHARTVVREFMETWSVDCAKETELVEAGMASFENAFNIYLKNGGALSDVEGEFPVYFGWWVRQAAAQYLK